MLERRKPHRPAHFEYVKPFVEQGVLVFGGPLIPEVDKGILVFKAADKKQVEDFAKSDPYVTNGLVETYSVREWLVVVGNELLLSK